MHALIMVALLILGGTSSAFGATYHVALTGVNPPSRTCAQAQNVSTPMRTINEGLKCALAGDTVLVAGGIFHERVDFNSSPGGSAAGGYVTLQGTPGATVLNGTGIGNGHMMYGRHVRYFKVKHFELAQFPEGGIYMFGSTDHVEITDNDIHDNSTGDKFGSGIRVTGKYSLGPNNVQGQEQGTGQFVTIARNNIYNIRTGFQGDLPEAGTETLTLGWNISNFLIEDNVLDNGQFIGIDLIGRDVTSPDVAGNTLPLPPNMYPRKGIIRRNVVTNLFKGLGAADAAFYCDGCEDIVYEYNRVDGSAGHCYVLSIEWHKSKTQRILMRHNIARACSSSMMAIGPGNALAEHLRVVHNTGIKTKEFGPVWRILNGTNVFFRANLGKVTTTASVPYLWHSLQTAPQIDYNLYHGDPTPAWEYQNVDYFTTFAAWQSGSGQDAHGKFQDPLVNTTTGALSAGSPAIDAGGFLTTVAAAVSPCVPTKLRVQDARYFIDGYGMVPGDTIRIGALTRQVMAVDYANNELTLDTSALGVTVGTPVSYPYVGAAPDIGACEFGVAGICQ